MTQQPKINAGDIALNANHFDPSARWEHEQIFKRAGLEPRYRHIATLSAIVIQKAWNDLPSAMDRAVGDGLAIAAICEVFIHTSLYIGTAATRQAIECARTHFNINANAVPLSPIPHVETADLMAAGNDMKAVLHGSRKEKGHADPDAPYAPALYKLATVFGYGHIWSRPGLSLKERLICAIAGFAVLPDAEGSFRKFSLSAAQNGCSIREIQETVIQTLPYVGFPRALKALVMMEEIFPEL